MSRTKPIHLLTTLGLLLLLLAGCMERDLARAIPPDLDAGSDILIPPTPTPSPTLPAESSDGGEQPTTDPGEGEGSTDPGGEQPVDDSGGEGEQPADGGEGGTTDVPPTEPAAPAEQTHIVAFGETVGLIAQSYGVTIEDIVVANNLANPNVITAGDSLRIVPGAAAAAGGGDSGDSGDSGTVEPPTGFDPNNYREHYVRFGETMFSIGQLYGFTVDELATYNEIADPTRIDAGQLIRIPIR